MEALNTGQEFPSAQLSLTHFIDKHYLLGCCLVEIFQEHDMAAFLIEMLIKQGVAVR